MAATKAELSRDRDSYYELLSQARLCERQADLSGALAHAVQALPLIDAMMQFERRYEKRSFDRIEAIDFILQYAPPLFDRDSLVRLAEVLAAQKRIDKNAEADLAADLEAARCRLWIAHALWDCLERSPTVNKGSLLAVTAREQEAAVAIVDCWKRWGFVREVTHQGTDCIQLTTRMADVVSCKCESCGAVGRVAKQRLLEPIDCPRCGSSGLFVFIATT